jgi:hypothetical protein
MFVARIVGSGVRRASASEYAQAIHGVCRDLADGMLDPESSAIQHCREALEEAAATFAKARQRAVGGGDGDSERPAIDALDFLLETLAKDLRDLIRVLQGLR